VTSGEPNAPAADVRATVVEPDAPLAACPRCQAPLPPDQDWCVECGLAARTRLAPTPNWRRPLLAAVAVAVIAVVALTVAFFALTGNDNPVPSATTAAPAPPAASEGQTQTAPATVATAAAPAQTVTVPGAATATQPAITAATTP
jgi:hypothetical protein